MSFDAIRWAYERQLPGSVKAVLLALAHCHNHSTGATANKRSRKSAASFCRS